MKKTLIRLTAILLSVLLLPVGISPVSAEDVLLIDGGEVPTVSDLGIEDGALELNCQSAILMEATTGAIIYTQNADEALPPASVTKIMTLLLIMEAIDSGTVRLDNAVSVSANAASMGGSQVYLKEGEQMSVEDLLKSVVIASANDAAVALAEYVAGSVNAFVEKMNAKARALGMTSTAFENVTGLDDTAENHLTSAKDIAIMSRELIKHPTILQYSSIWMDTIRNGEFGLTNTNRLVRFYRGCTGLKTGSTSKAGFCVSVTAERDGFSLICVIMGAQSRDIRNAEATELLDWGFANYGLYTNEEGSLPPITVKGGVKDTCQVAYPSFSIVLPRGAISSVKQTVSLENEISAPVSASDKVGSITFISGGKTIGEVPIVAAESVEKINFFQIFQRMLAKFLLI
ncbi:MAG: D-alanyl-D-alanine carboxypeptidase [Clostridia bacterium]|nr:D-alanyl-D-alanine carboxypeptidase [Clostridia bacterium]